MEVLKIRDINGNWIEIPYLKGDIPGLSEYQKKLTAGTNITIDENNVISATGGGVTEEQVNTLIDSKTTSYNFKIGEENTVVGLRIVKDLWAGNWNNYNLTFNGEPVHKVFKNETNKQLVFTILRADYQNPSGPLLIGRLITLIVENNEVVGYAVLSESLGGQYIVGHTDAQINTLIDNKNLQPKLTAGTNITIDANNVISATGGGSSSGVEILDHDITQDELLAMPSKLFYVPNTPMVNLNVFKNGSVVQLRLNSSLLYWSSEVKVLTDISYNQQYSWEGESTENPGGYFTVYSTVQIGDGLADVYGIIRATNNGVSEERVNQLIDTKLGVIENGSY